MDYFFHIEVQSKLEYLKSKFLDRKVKMARKREAIYKTSQTGLEIGIILQCGKHIQDPA